eukprot:TRINITY_DN5278_c0_g1_i20.p2 TRINITY_DN5278_c0_g1~~TRINITY_DN5278_c0_g1_i20.p2  ORF type:complete len:139 (+),score=30.11 TRINITY_DN5278_c0_g1_i20:331-747(+)
MKRMENTFAIKRLTPEDADALRKSWIHPQKSIQRSYKITNDEQRYEFLRRVIHKEMTVSEAAANFGMNYTTAKNVLNLYIREGRIEKKKRRLRGNVPSKDPRADTQHNSASEENSLKHTESAGLGASFWMNRIAELIT